MKHPLVYIAGLQVSSIYVWYDFLHDMGLFFVSFQCLLQSFGILSNVSYFVSLNVLFPSSQPQ